MNSQPRDVQPSETKPRDITANGASYEPELRIDRVDPERRLGIRSGRFTQPSHLMCLIVGLLGAVAIYASITPLEGMWIHETLTGRGIIPYLIIGFSMWAATILVVKRMKIRAQTKALAVSIVPTDPGFILTPETAQGVLDQIHLRVDHPEQFILFNRVLIAISNLRNIGRISDVDDILSSKAEHDESMMESGYTVLRGLVWGIPVLGFIGTVIGLSDAIGSFGAVLTAGSELDQLRGALTSVTAGLAVAFETTLQALTAAFVIQLGLIFVRRADERLLDDCREYCQRRLVARLRIVAPIGATGGAGS